MKKFPKIAIALLCLCLLQCHSLTEALKEIANAQTTGGQKEEPQPQPKDTNTDNNTGRQRK